MKIKIKASARINRRHLLIEGAGKKEIEDAILEFVGVLGWAKAAPVILESDGDVILSIDRKELNNIRAAFEMSEKKMKILRVSGTLKGLGRKL